MANSGGKESNTSQWFITLGKARPLNSRKLKERPGSVTDQKMIVLAVTTQIERTSCKGNIRCLERSQGRRYTVGACRFG